MPCHPLGSLLAVFRNAVRLALVLAALPIPAAAQRVVVSYSDASFPTPLPVTQSWDFAARQLEWSLPALLDGVPVFTSDGRYLVARVPSTGPPSIRLVDVMTRTAVDLAIDFEPRVAHPRRTEIFGLTALGVTGATGTVARLDATGLRLYGGCAVGTTRAVDLTADGGLLLALCDSGDVVVMDGASGAVLRTVSAGASESVATMRSSEDGSKVLVTRSALAEEVALIDTTSGAELGTTVFPDASPSPSGAPCLSGWLVGTSPDRRMAAITCAFSSPPAPPPSPGTRSTVFRTRMMELETLTWGQELGVPGRPGPFTISPDNATAFVGSFGPLIVGGALQAIDLASGAPIVEITGSTSSIAAAFAPLAPALTATIVGNRVDMQWHLPAHSPAATRYVLEVGTATGLIDLGTLALGPGASHTFPSVPPGNYVARLRADNASGTGPTSNEVAITVR